MLELTGNGRGHTVDVEPEVPLRWVLRDHLGLRGTKYGSGIARCGARTVHVDGEASTTAAGCSAVLAATGKRIRSLPLEDHDGLGA